MFQLNEMNGKIIGRKPLYVAVAQRKEERKAWLQVILIDFDVVMIHFLNYFDSKISIQMHLASMTVLLLFVLRFTSSLWLCFRHILLSLGPVVLCPL